MKISWEYHIRVALTPKQIFGLNNAYGHIVRRGRKGPYAQRYLLPDAKAYKERWKRVFDLYDQYEKKIQKYHDLPEAEKPLLAIRLTWLYQRDHFAFGTGRLKGFDLSNLVKLIEDSFCEYIGVDDSRTLWCKSTKRPIEHMTQCVLSVGYVVLQEEEIEGMVEVYKGKLPNIVAYVFLPVERKDEVDGLLEEYVTSAAAVGAVRTSLEEFGADAAMILTCIAAMTRKGLLKPGLWEKLVPLIEGEGEGGTIAPPRARNPRKKKGPAMRGKLPFGSLPSRREAPAEFMAKWERRNLRKKKYPEDMLNWETGEINWESDEVYGHKKEKGEIPRWVYRQLVAGKKTYEDFKKHGFLQSKVDRALKKFIVGEPAYLPPGAGMYCEEESTGDMWIERVPLEALEITRRYAPV